MLDGYRAAADEAPLLVVPTYADVVRYRRELADDGLVFGTAIVRFRQLASEMARRGGVRGRGLCPAAARAGRGRRDRGRAARRPAPLRRHARGSPRALVRLASELEQGRVDPARFTQRPAHVGGAARSRAAYAEELAALYSGYRRALEATGRTDDDLRLAAAVDALREDPARWGAPPVFVYGFDDLRPLQREALAVLAATGAEVTVSLTFEAGRYAFAGRTETVEALRPVADRVVELPAIPDHYASPALHHLERRLFEPPEDGALFDAAAPEPGGAITLMEGGGERAELELVAAEVARLIREDGVAPEEIAVVARDAAASRAARCVACSPPPACRSRSTRRAVFGHTPLGARARRAAALRAARRHRRGPRSPGCARPGSSHEPALADRLEARARQEGARTRRGRPRAVGARALAARRDRPRRCRARARPAARSCERCRPSWRRGSPRRTRGRPRSSTAREAARRPRARRRAPARSASSSPQPAPALAPDARRARRAARGARRSACATSRAPARVDGQPSRCRCARAACARWSSCGLQEGALPAARAARAVPRRRRAPRARRGLGPACCAATRTRSAPSATSSTRRSRGPEERLVLALARRAATTASPAVRSLFVDDVATCSARAVGAPPARARSAQVGWATAPPTRASAGAARRPPARATARRRSARCAAEVLAAICASATRGRRRRIEVWAGCPVRWFVERRLRPRRSSPTPSCCCAAQLAHAALERALRAPRARDGSAASTPGPPARRRARPSREALEGCAERIRHVARPAPRSARSRAGWRPTSCATSSTRRTTALARAGALEVAFGGASDDRARSSCRAGVRIARAHRPHRRRARRPRRRSSTTTRAARDRRRRAGVDERKCQVALYLRRRARRCSASSRSAGCTSRSARSDQRPRGAGARGRRPRPGTVATDRRDAGGVRGAASTASSRHVLEAVAELRAGRARAAAGDLRAGRRRLRVSHRSAAASDGVSVAGFTDRAGGARSRGARARCCSRPTPAAARRRCSSSASCASVLEDGVRPGRILAITFTEKAAGELRARVRARFARARPPRGGARDRGAPGSRRSTASARACCAPTRSPPGWTRRSRCSTSAVARELRAAAWRARRSRGWLDGERRRGALDVAAAYGVDRLREAIATVHDALRSAGADRVPRLPRRAAAPARRRAAPSARARGGRARRALPARRARPRSRPAERGARGARRSRGERACRAGRSVRPTYKMPTRSCGPGCTALPRRALEAWLASCRARRAGAPAWPRCSASCCARYASAFADAKRARAALDFDDLELLRARPAARRRRRCARPTRTRFARVMVDEFQDTNPLQLELVDLLGAGRRVRRRGRAAVDLRLPPRRRRGVPRPPRGARRSAARPRRCDELPQRGRDPRRGQRRVRAALRRRVHAAASPGAAPGRRPGRAVELLLTDTRRAGTTSTSAALPRRAGLAPRRGAAARPARARARRRRRGRAGGRRRAAARRRLAAGLRARAARTRACRRWRSAGAATGAARSCATCARGSRRSPTRATRSRSTACWPRRSSGRRPTRWRSSGRPARPAGHAWQAIAEAFLRTRRRELPAGSGPTTASASARSPSASPAERALAPRLGLDELLERVVARRLRPARAVAARRRAAAGQRPQAPAARRRRTSASRPRRARLRRPRERRAGGRGARGRRARRARRPRRGAAHDDPRRQGPGVRRRLRRRPRAPAARRHATTCSSRDGEVGLRLVGLDGSSEQALAYPALRERAHGGGVGARRRASPTSR